jgi:hypothetical protein
MDNAKLAEWVWKALTLLLSVIVIPTFGWVWMTHSNVNSLDLKVEILERSAREGAQYKEDVIGMKKDIEYMRGSLLRIEDAVSKRGNGR